MAKTTTPKVPAAAPASPPDLSADEKSISENSGPEINEHGIPTGVLLSLEQVQQMLRSMRAKGIDVDPESEEGLRKRK